MIKTCFLFVKDGVVTNRDIRLNSLFVGKFPRDTVAMLVKDNSGDVRYVFIIKDRAEFNKNYVQEKCNGVVIYGESWSTTINCNDARVTVVSFYFLRSIINVMQDARTGDFKQIERLIDEHINQKYHMLQDTSFDEEEVKKK